MNYEVDAYVEASKRFPPRDVELETAEGTYYFFKADILRGEVTYSSDKHIPANLKTITARRAKQVVEINKRGEKPETLLEDGDARDERRSADLLEQNNIDRFDNASRNKRRKRHAGGRDHRNDSRKGRRNDDSKAE